MYAGLTDKRLVNSRRPLHIHHTHPPTLCYDNLTQIFRKALPIQAASGRPSWDVRPLKALSMANGITHPRWRAESKPSWSSKAGP